ncbi:MAG: hypothetical protein NUK65_10345 [Firmicutes bacterium]|nr:hypothetical protein [Bacillota bacterium]
MQRESNHSGLDVEMVEKEIRRLHQQALPSVFRRFHYHCLRQGQQDLGPISTSKVKPREQGDDAPLAMVETIMTAATRRLLGGDQRARVGNGDH